MYGVVLWSDQAEQKAVIWCEDHGDLAYYGGSASSLFDGPVLDAGDLIEFQLLESATLRLVRNPELIAEQHAPAIAERLKATADPVSSPLPQNLKERQTSICNVLQFPALRTA
ncbi:hypothetical protein [Lentibacter sp.]|uniref:hypothetical protein n=1 Tax=Lentibacter sp. TaxID=2024994 RepID=UPI003F6A4191